MSLLGMLLDANVPTAKSIKAPNGMSPIGYGSVCNPKHPKSRPQIRLRMLLAQPALAKRKEPNQCLRRVTQGFAPKPVWQA